MKMNKTFFRLIGLMTLLSVSFSYAQTACSPGSYAVFSNSNGQAPVVLNVLGTSPQFGEIPKHTAASAFSHLKSVYKRNVKNSKGELDNFFRALGYSGLNDSQFSVNKIEPQTLSAGTTGWMGAYSKGHKYAWSTLGKDFPTFKIMSADGSCSAYIMKKCGNAFYDPTARCIPCTPCDPNYNDAVKCPNGAAAVALAALPKTTCGTQTINFSGKGKIQAGDVLNTTQTFPVVATFGGQNLCLGDYTVPVRLTYDLSASGEASYSKTVKVCDYGNGTAANANINLPLDLKYAFGASDVTVGDNGKMMLAVSDKQFKTLKTVYKVCPSDMPSTAGKTLVAKTIDNAAVSNGGPAATEGAGCVKQTWNMSGSGAADEVSSKTNNAEVTLIGVYNKTGKLQKGETAEKNLCLGSYSVPAKSALQFGLNGNSSMAHVLEVCGTEGTTSTSENIAVPMSLTNSVSKQEVMVGDYGRIYVPLTKAQYNKLKKNFKRCCSDGSTGKCF
jgi:hypothetical protein